MKWVTTFFVRGHTFAFYLIKVDEVSIDEVITSIDEMGQASSPQGGETCNLFLRKQPACESMEFVQSLIIHMAISEFLLQAIMLFYHPVSCHANLGFLPLTP